MLLKGGNVRKIFLVLSGVGNNAKSVIMELLELMLGQYMIKFPTSMITGKRTQSSQASPEMMRSVGVRFAVLQEPSGKDMLNVGILKELTGNDSMYGRGLYKDGEEIKPMFNLALICNNLPRLPSDDPACWDRVKVLSHEARFLHASQCPKTIEEQRAKKIFPRDTEFSEKLPGMRQAFFWILVQERKRILRVGRMADPKQVIEATETYKNRNNVFLQFIKDMIIDDENSSISIMEIYTHFREWFRNNLPAQVVPVKLEMQEDLIHRWGAMKGNKWKGHRLRTVKDDELEGKVLTIDIDEKSMKEIEQEVIEEERAIKEEKRIPKKVVEKNIPSPKLEEKKRNIIQEEEEKEIKIERVKNKQMREVRRRTLRNTIALQYRSDDDSE